MATTSKSRTNQYKGAAEQNVAEQNVEETIDRKSRTNQDKGAAEQNVAEQNVEETIDRIRELNERIVESSRKVGKVSLDAYEQALLSIADFEERVAGTSQIEWVSAVANAQASFIREMGKSYSAAGRDLVK